MKARAVLLDRDGTLVVDRPDNRDPGCIELMPGTARALQRLREHGVRIGVITNQPAIAAKTIRLAEMQALHARLEKLAGPFDGWFVCAHNAVEGCACRKPQPGLILDAGRTFGLDPGDCVVIGDIGGDVRAAQRAGARAVLVPTAATREDEIAQAPAVARSLDEAVDLILSGAV